MEAFSLLKYWRNGGGGGSGVATTTTSVSSPDSTANARTITKTIVTAAAVSPYSSDGEEGPYFDLEFALPDPESDNEEDPSAESQDHDDPEATKTEDEDETESGSDEEEISVHENDEEEDDEEEAELKLALTSGDCTDQNVTLSSSDDLFSKGNLVSIEPSSILLNASEDNLKFPVSLVKSATKFRVLLLKLKKSKSSNGDSVEIAEKDEVEIRGEREKRSKFLAVKFKVEEVPLVSLFTRDTSSKENHVHGKGLKNNNVEDSDPNAASDEKKLTKELMQKYLKMVKPFYVRVSKRYVEKLKFSGNLSFPGGGSRGCAAAQIPPEKGGEVVAEAAAPTNLTTHPKQGNINLQAGLKVVKKHLGKSRSASAAVATAPPGKTTSNRRDDSLLQLQDGIQGAILHCKRSFNASGGNN